MKYSGLVLFSTIFHDDGKEIYAKIRMDSFITMAFILKSNFFLLHEKLFFSQKSVMKKVYNNLLMLLSLFFPDVGGMAGYLSPSVACSLAQLVYNNMYIAI